MSKLSVYAIYDMAVGAYLPPFYSRSSGEAIRSFTDACNQKDSPFYKHASDFYLTRIGEFDDASGHFSTGEPLRLIGATEVVHDDIFTPGSYTPAEGFPRPVNGGG